MAIWNAADDSQIYYELYGDEPDKPALLLLPGLLGSISIQWKAFVSPLSQRYRLLLTDLRGHGRSHNKANTLLPEQMVEDIGGLLDHLSIERAHIAGYSLGGYLGLSLALEQPRRVQSLLMHAAKFYWTRETVAEMRRQLDPDAMSEKTPAYADQLAREHGGSHWRSLVRQAADLVSYISENGLTEGMAARCQPPVLVTVGDRDELVTLPEAQRLSRVFRHGQLMVLPGTRHSFASVKPVPLLPVMQAFHEGA